MHMHKSHFAGCAVAILLVVGYLAVTGVSPTGITLLVAVLACPIAMVVAMKLLMGSHSKDDRRTAA